jgi:hypothetical protein
MTDVRKKWYAPHNHNDGQGPHQHFPNTLYSDADDHQGVKLLPFPEGWIAQPESRPREAITDGERLARMGTDARAWAAEFLNMHRGKQVVLSEEDANQLGEWTLISWFASAIETGRSAGQEGYQGMATFRVNYRKESGGGMDTYKGNNIHAHPDDGLIIIQEADHSIVAIINADDIWKVERVDEDGP